MGKVVKAIGSVVSAPARGIGHALGTSGIPILSNIGSTAENLGNAVAGKGSFLQDIGKAGEQFAPVAGMIPGVGPLAAGALGMGGGLLNKGLNSGGFSEGAKYGIQGGLSGLLHGGAGANTSGLGGVASKIGGALKGNFTNPEGGLDIGKLVSTGGTIADMIGRGQQRKSAQNYSNAEIQQRNALMSKILAPQSYNLNQQSGSTPGAGAGTTGGNY